MAALAGGEPGVRRDTVYTLGRALEVTGRRRHPRRQLDRVFHELTARLRGDPDESVREEIAHVLTFWFERRAARVLLGVLVDRGEGARVRAQAAEGVGNVLDRSRLAPPERERIREALADGLRDGAAVVRFWCLYAVGTLQLTELRPEVERLAATDHEAVLHWWRVSEEAADVLTCWDTGRWPDRDRTISA